MTYDELMQRYGTARAAAAALNLKPPVVGNWKQRGIPLPWQRVLQMMPAPAKRRSRK